MATDLSPQYQKIMQSRQDLKALIVYVDGSTDKFMRVLDVEIPWMSLPNKAGFPEARFTPTREP